MEELDDLYEEELAEDEERRTNQQAENAKFAESLVYLMSDKRGRRFVGWLLEVTGVRKTSFSPDIARMSFFEGHRNIGNQICEVLEREVPELYLQLLNEEINDRRSSGDD